MLKRLKRWVRAALDPPWTRDGPETFTLAVPEAHSAFKAGDEGWSSRPPAVVRCPTCSSLVTHAFADDVVACSTCSWECSPDEFPALELVALVCPDCRRQLDYGVRHPSLVEVPEWASCTSCQYHWEYQHDF